MYFCENCNAAMPTERCGVCGKKKLREVQGDDFCYFVTLKADRAHTLEETLKLENIPVAMLGAGLDLRTRTSANFRLYVPYKYFTRAEEVRRTIFGEN